MDEGRFEFLRKELCEKIYLEEELDEEFNKKFYKLIEYCNFSLMEKDDNFFALFFVQMKREIKFDLSETVATRVEGTNFVMYFNPKLFLVCTLKEMKALIKHEIYHIMSRHHARARALKSKYSNLAISLAMDISINQYIMYLPSWAYKIENVKKTYNLELKEDQPMEVYAAQIQEAIDRITKKTKISEENFKVNHEIWDTMLDNSYVEQMDEVIKKNSNNAARGKMPESISMLIKALNNKPEITWKEHLKRTLGIIPAGKKKTIMRKDRRQPERLDIRGQLSNRIAKLVVAIDISGSVSDLQIEHIMTEILSLVKNYPYDITLIECDSEIRRTYKVKSIKDVKEKINTKGGTKFSPVFQYVQDNKLKDHVLIYFTDGLGEKLLNIKPYNYKTIWVLTGDEEKISLQNTTGIVIKLHSKVEKESVDVFELVRNEMQDIRSEWAACSP